MASESPILPSSHRLAEQLRVLSEVTESLTYRLVELEERLAAQEENLGQLLEGSDAAGEEEMEERLSDTEQRLARIETVLRGIAGSTPPRHLMPVHPPAFQQEPMAQRPPEDPSEDPLSESQPFPDEGEQPFMDELIA